MNSLILFLILGAFIYLFAKNFEKLVPIIGIIVIGHIFYAIYNAYSDSVKFHGLKLDLSIATEIKSFTNNIEFKSINNNSCTSNESFIRTDKWETCHDNFSTEQDIPDVVNLSECPSIQIIVFNNSITVSEADLDEFNSKKIEIEYCAKNIAYLAYQYNEEGNY